MSPSPVLSACQGNLISHSSDLPAVRLCGAELHEDAEGLQPAGASHPVVLLPHGLQVRRSTHFHNLPILILSLQAF